MNAEIDVSIIYIYIHKESLQVGLVVENFKGRSGTGSITFS